MAARTCVHKFSRAFPFRDCFGKFCLFKFPLRDLKKVPSESAAKVNLLFHEMESKGRMEDMERLSRLLFAVGMTSGKALFPPDISGNSRYLGDKVKRAVPVD